MDLAEAPIVLMLVGLAAYAVLGGADFGAGFELRPVGVDEHRDADARKNLELYGTKAGASAFSGRFM